MAPFQVFRRLFSDSLLSLEQVHRAKVAPSSLRPQGLLKYVVPQHPTPASIPPFPASKASLIADLATYPASLPDPDSVTSHLTDLRPGYLGAADLLPRRPGNLGIAGRRLYQPSEDLHILRPGKRPSFDLLSPPEQVYEFCANKGLGWGDRKELFAREGLPLLFGSEELCAFEGVGWGDHEGLPGLFGSEEELSAHEGLFGLGLPSTVFNLDELGLFGCVDDALLSLVVQSPSAWVLFYLNLFPDFPIERRLEYSDDPKVHNLRMIRSKTGKDPQPENKPKPSERELRLFADMVAKKGLSLRLLQSYMPNLRSNSSSVLCDAEYWKDVYDKHNFRYNLSRADYFGIAVKLYENYKKCFPFPVGVGEAHPLGIRLTAEQLLDGWPECRGFIVLTQLGDTDDVMVTSMGIQYTCTGRFVPGHIQFLDFPIDHRRLGDYKIIWPGSFYPWRWRPKRS